jgi:YNFM family putative membrane transporter
VNLRYLALAFCGGTAFLDMYATQPLLPEFRTLFHASEAAVGATISALIFACALAAPFIGPLADRIGRKRIIVTSIVVLGLVTFGAATATTLPTLVAWRFAQGLLMPGVFAVTLAYIAEEFPVAVAGQAVGAYIGGNVFGGFLGRYLTAVITPHANWQTAFVVLGSLNLVGALVVFIGLPRATNFRPSASLRESLAAIGGFFRRPEMAATYFVGGAILFTLTATFTYATFYLAGDPFDLSTAALGNVFFVYLAGVVAAPISGRLIDRYGNRFTLTIAMAASACGIVLSLVHVLWLIVLGLALTSTGVFVAQAASQGYVGRIAGAQRSTAASLYIMLYYAGGGLGAIVPAFTWTRGGWPATVALIVAVQAVAVILTRVFWSGRIASDTPALT